MTNDPLTILCGDALTKLRELPDESVQCCVTSPPYWGLRDYGTAEWEGGEEGCDHKTPATGGNPEQGANKGNNNFEAAPFKSICGKCGAKRIDSQLGLEKTPEEYVSKMVEVFREVRRVLRKDGTLWLNLGDSYASSWPAPNTRRNIIDNPMSGGKRGPQRPARMGAGLKEKDLIGIPWRVAFALQADGCADYKAVQTINRVRNELLNKYEDEVLPDKVLNVLTELDAEYSQAKEGSWWLRQDIIWSKPNPMPESVTDRCTKSHEYLFLLTKSSRYFYNAEEVKEPSCDFNGTSQRYESPFGGVKSETLKATRFGNTKICGPREFDGSRNKRSVWTVATAPYPEAHFATYPPDLIKPCIMAGSRCGDTVLDPFAGSGTTGMVALELGRKSVLIELNSEYVDLIRSRCDVTPGLLLK